MNCEEGDLAIVLGGPASAGLIVRCLKFVGLLPVFPGSTHTDVWLVDRALPWAISGNVPYMTDSLLRPIRDTDAPDKTQEQWEAFKTQYLVPDKRIKVTA